MKVEGEEDVENHDRLNGEESRYILGTMIHFNVGIRLIEIYLGMANIQITCDVIIFQI